MKTLATYLMAFICVYSPATALCEPVDRVYGYEVERLATAIFYAEGGNATRHPYGILTKYKTTTPRQACINTIRNQAKRHSNHKCGLSYLECLQRRYAPVGAENDPTGLNKNWLMNVSRLYGGRNDKRPV